MPLPFNPSLLKSKRLTFTALTQKDLHPFYEVINHDAVRYPIAFLPKQFNLKDAENFIHHAEKEMQEKQDLFLSIWDVQNNYMGFAGLHETDHANELEIGYWLAESEWGKGYATEITQCLCEYAFTLPNVKRLIATTALDNIGSQRVLEKCGFIQIGTKNRETTDGDIRPSCLYQKANAKPPQA